MYCKLLDDRLEKYGKFRANIFPIIDIYEDGRIYVKNLHERLFLDKSDIVIVDRNIAYDPKSRRHEMQYSNVCANFKKNQEVKKKNILKKASKKIKIN